MDQKQLRGEKGSFQLILARHSPSLRKIRAGTVGDAACRLTHGFMFSRLSQTACLGNDTAYGGQVLLHQLTIKTMPRPPNSSTGKFDLGNSSVEALLSDDLRLYHTDN